MFWDNQVELPDNLYDVAWKVDPPRPWPDPPPVGTKYASPTSNGVDRREYLAILRMLVARATWRDRLEAKKRKGHWLNVAKREILIE